LFFYFYAYKFSYASGLVWMGVLIVIF
jgi:hypothetical protein